MITHLDHVATISSDPANAPIMQTTTPIHTGRPGCPWMEIDRDVLATALQMRGPSHLAPVFGVCA